MDIKEVVQPLEEMIVRYRSEETDEYTLIAHREFIWLLYLEEDDDDPVWNDIEEKTGERDINYLQERPDILTGYYHPNSNSLYLSSSSVEKQHPITSKLIKKVAKQLGIQEVSYEAFDYDGEPDEKIYFRSELKGKLPDVGYHGTASAYASNILKFGLDYNRGTGNWEQIGQFPAVYFAVLSSTAEFHANRTSDNTNYSVPVVFKFKIPDKNKIVADYDVASEVGMDPEKAGELEYTASNAYYSNNSEEQRQKIQKYNPKSKLYQHASVFGYAGRVPASFITSISVKFSDDLGSWHEFNNSAEFLKAMDIYNNYEQWYPGIEDDIEE
jgi:hypothetical protein